MCEPSVSTISSDSDLEQYQQICDEALIGANAVRWWGSSGRWGIHGSRSLEIAVAGQVGDAHWPRSADCDVLTIDAAMRSARASDDARQKLGLNYDELSWDPALEDRQALTTLVELCREVVTDQVDPVVAIRRFVDVLDRTPKPVRRIRATGQLHQAWSRTQYILLDADRAPFGPLLLAQNDSNHQRHSDEERQLVRLAAQDPPVSA